MIMDLKRFSPAFQRSIQNKALPELRSIVVSTIELDTHFKTGEYDAMMECIKENGIRLEVPYKKQPGEEQYDDRKDNPELWDEDYFFLLTEWLRNNFAPKERLPQIKRVGPKVRPPLDSNFFQAPQEPESLPAPRTSSHQSWQTQPPKSGWSSKQIAAVIAAAAAVLALVAMIFKLLK